MARVQSQPGPDTTGICSLCHRAFMGSSASSRQVRRQSVFTKFRAACCHCFAPCPCFASCHCCHDPLIVRNAQTRPPFTGVTQLAHPSRCSRSTLRTVRFCALVSVALQQDTNPANLQCCCITEARDLRISFQHLRISSLILRSPSWTRSCIQKNRVPKCFVCCPAPNRSVKVFARRTVALYFNLHWNSQILVK